MARRLVFTMAISHKDIDKAQEITKWISELTPQNDDEALIVFSRLAQATGNPGKVIDNLKLVFKEVTAILLQHEDERGEWFSPNFMFKETAIAVRNHFAPTYDMATWTAEGFYFFEPDVTPLVPDWWNRIKTAYDNTTKPFMGKIRPTVENETGANPGASRGSHMNGSAVYPVDLHKWAGHVFLADDIPWDVYAQEQITGECADSALFQVQYGKDPYLNLDNVDERAVVLHGCKDGSLLKLLRSGTVKPQPRVEREVKPTIADLEEAIERGVKVTIQPDGQCCMGPKDPWEGLTEEQEEAMFLKWSKRLGYELDEEEETATKSIYDDMPAPMVVQAKTLSEKPIRRRKRRAKRKQQVAQDVVA